MRVGGHGFGGRRAPAVLSGAAAAGLLAIGLLLPALSVIAAPAAQAAVDSCALSANPVVCENNQPGAPQSEWDVGGSGDETIQGYATDISVNEGQQVSFKINTDARAYKIDIYRLGYYGGAGARKVGTASPSVALPQTQPNCMTDASTSL